MNNEKNLQVISSIPPKNDVVFKRLFGMKGNEEILKDFLESILGMKIESLELDVSKEFEADFYDGKKSIVDVRATLSNGIEINVEMQNNSNNYSEQRCLYYWSRIYSNGIKKAKKYTDLKKTICIWFLNEDVYHDTTEFETKWRLKCENESLKNHFDYIQFHVIELQKFRNDATIKPSKKNFWLWFLDHTNEEMVKMACNNYEKIREAREELEKITADPEVRNQIIREDMAEYDENTRIAKATEKGKEEEKVKIAKKMKSKGLDIDTIIEVTGLSRIEVENI